MARGAVDALPERLPMPQIDTTFASMDVVHVFDEFAAAEGPMFKLSAEIAGEILTIEVLEGKAFENNATKRGAPWAAVLRGDHVGKWNTGGKDTDSVQVAVRWSNATEEDVGRDTNAESTSPVLRFPRGLSPRERGAEWILGGDSPHQWAFWPTLVPKGATHLVVIIIYTDTLDNTFADGGADLPLIIGAFSADLKDGKWTMTASPDDTFPPQDERPTREQLAGIWENTRDALLEATGYPLVPRPVGSSPTNTRAQNRKAINDALQARTINTNVDTGSDILRSWPQD
jgi:hypothetical protein